MSTMIVSIKVMRLRIEGIEQQSCRNFDGHGCGRGCDRLSSVRFQARGKGRTSGDIRRGEKYCHTHDNCPHPYTH